MLFSIITTSGITMMGSQAPLVNLETPTTSRTIPVAMAPTALITSDPRQPDSRSVRWCLTMPTCDSVNEVNTPTA